MNRTYHPAFDAAPDWRPLDDDDDHHDDEEDDGDVDRASGERECGPVATRARSPLCTSRSSMLFLWENQQYASLPMRAKPQQRFRLPTGIPARLECRSKGRIGPPL
jgi:hypothetical protein